MKVAIIGAGAVGINLLYEFIRFKERFNDLEIIVFDGTPLEGTGLPYQEDDDAIRLNQVSEKMSITAEDPQLFIKWLEEQGLDQDPAGKYFPRNLFGRFMQDYLNQLKKQDFVQVVHEPVKDIHFNQDQTYQLVTYSKNYTVDSVQLALGHMAYNDFYNLAGEENYFHHPYPMKGRIPNFSKDDRVAILGTGLTSIDLMFYTQKNYDDMPVDFLSLEKSFAAVRNLIDDVPLNYLSAEKVESLIAKKEMSLDRFIELFDQEMADKGLDLETMWNHYGQGSFENMKKDFEHIEKLGIMQSIINQNKKYTGYIWNQFSRKDKDRFTNEYSKQFLNYRATLPQDVAQYLIRGHEKNLLNIYIGIKKIEKKGKEFKVYFEDSDEVRTYDYILNGTGQATDLRNNVSNQQELVQNLINKEAVQAYPYGGILTTYPDMSLIHPKLGKLSTFKVYGQLSSGIDIMNNTTSKLNHTVVNGINDLLS